MSLRHFVISLCFLLAGVSLALPAIGPSLDDHFVERQWGHDHLFFGYPAAHTHHYGSPLAPDALKPPGELGAEIVYLTAAAGCCGAGAAFVAPALASLDELPSLPDATYLLGRAAAVAIPPDAFTTPLDKPPRE